jgi:hypothetical protein
VGRKQAFLETHERSAVPTLSQGELEHCKHSWEKGILALSEVLGI